MNAFHKAWIALCASTVMGYGGVQYSGWAPGTCTDTRALNPAAQQLTPCSPAQSTTSLRSRHYYGGK